MHVPFVPLAGVDSHEHSQLTFSLMIRRPVPIPREESTSVLFPPLVPT